MNLNALCMLFEKWCQHEQINTARPGGGLRAVSISTVNQQRTAEELDPGLDPVSNTYCGAIGRVAYCP